MQTRERVLSLPLVVSVLRMQRGVFMPIARITSRHDGGSTKGVCDATDNDL
jgi:hypothetical protein